MSRLTDHCALVTGGASGLGLAIARRLKAEGAKVLITDIQEHDGRTVASKEGLIFLHQDVCDEDRWNSVLAEAEARVGRLDILVNNAGILGPKDAFSPVNTRLADWRRIFTVNVESVFLGCRAAVPVLARNGRGSIVNMSSVAGLLATPYATAYGASKAAVRHLTKSVAQYCAQAGLPVRCNSVHPGNVLTPMLQTSYAELALNRGVPVDAIIEERKRSVPMGDFTLPDDVAAMVSFLASADARHVTGAEFIVDGGIKNCDTFHLMPAREQR